MFDKVEGVLSFTRVFAVQNGGVPLPFFDPWGEDGRTKEPQPRIRQFISRPR